MLNRYHRTNKHSSKCEKNNALDRRLEQEGYIIAADKLGQSAMAAAGRRVH
jgi:hypothetical protein